MMRWLLRCSIRTQQSFSSGSDQGKKSKIGAKGFLFFSPLKALLSLVNVAGRVFSYVQNIMLLRWLFLMMTVLLVSSRSSSKQQQQLVAVDWRVTDCGMG